MVMRVMWLPSAIHMAPSGPAAMRAGAKRCNIMSDMVVTSPAMVMRPIPLPPSPAGNHMAPSGPAAISLGDLNAVGIEYSVMEPRVVIRPIFPNCVNHIAPSGPAAMPPEAFTIGYSVTTPPRVIRPMLRPFWLLFVNHMAPPSGPAAPSGPAVISVMKSSSARVSKFSSPPSIVILLTLDGDVNSVDPVAVQPSAPIHIAPSRPAAMLVSTE